jgi:hypothetical protein
MPNPTLSPRILRLVWMIFAAAAILALLAGCGHGGGGY